MAGKNKAKSVALFATCLIDLWRPGVARAAVRLLEDAGVKVGVPGSQTCCGQVNYNGGDANGAKTLATHHIRVFEKFDYVVVPSGSCADMIKNHYPGLFEDDQDMKKKALALAKKTFELTVFLTTIAKWTPSHQETGALKITYHDSCSCRRHLGIQDQPRRLIAAAGHEIAELPGDEVCCGFGGLFAVKFGDISSHLADKKCAAIKATGAKTLVGADLGCLLNLEGRLKALGEDIEVLHIAEFLARGIQS